MWNVVRRLIRYRGLLAILTSRELKARYRGSLFGWLWSLVNPLVLVVVYTIVFSYIFDPRDSRIDPYGLFLVTGLFPWIWLQTSMLEGTGSLLVNAGLIRKAAFPAELLPLVPVIANLVHLAFALPVIAAGFAVAHVMGYEISGPSSVLFPVIVLIQLPLVAGLTLGLAALNAHFKDVKDLLANVLTLFFFMTPILYTLSMVETVRPIYLLVKYNPLTPFVLAYQQAVFFGQIPPLSLWLAMAVISTLGWGLGTALFDRLSGTLVEAL